MRWDKDIQLPVPGTYRQKDEALERLLLSGWHKEDGLGRNADGILPYVVDSCRTLDRTLSDHYRDFLAGHLRFKGSMSGMQDILCRLYFCDSEEDIWDMVLEGLGDVDSFIFTYAGYPGRHALDDRVRTASPERLERFCRYIEKDFPEVRTKVDFIRNTMSTFGPGIFTIYSISNEI